MAHESEVSISLGNDWRIVDQFVGDNFTTDYTPPEYSIRDEVLETIDPDGDMDIRFPEDRDYLELKFGNIVIEQDKEPTTPTREWPVDSGRKVLQLVSCGREAVKIHLGVVDLDGELDDASLQTIRISSHGNVTGYDTFTGTKTTKIKDLAPLIGHFAKVIDSLDT